jgi:hypothetical protein
MSLDDLIKRDKSLKRGKGARGGKAPRGALRGGFKGDRQSGNNVPRFKNKGGAIFKQSRGGNVRANRIERRPRNQQVRHRANEG